MAVRRPKTGRKTANKDKSACQSRFGCLGLRSGGAPRSDKRRTQGSRASCTEGNATGDPGCPWCRTPSGPGQPHPGGRWPHPTLPSAGEAVDTAMSTSWSSRRRGGSQAPSPQIEAAPGAVKRKPEASSAWGTARWEAPSSSASILPMLLVPPAAPVLLARFNRN